jgi:hypothetical protein
VPAGRTALLGLLLLVSALAACGSNGDASDGGTHLEIEGVATTGTGIAPLDPTDPSTPVPDPSDAPQVDISGSVSCDGAPTGTGVYAATAIQICADLASRQGVFQQIEESGGEVCGEVYGGPQRATITGSVAGQSVDVTVERNDSCGIQDWETLEWLLGPPER